MNKEPKVSDDMIEDGRFVSEELGWAMPGPIGWTWRKYRGRQNAYACVHPDGAPYFIVVTDLGHADEPTEKSMAELLTSQPDAQETQDLQFQSSEFPWPGCYETVYNQGLPGEIDKQVWFFSTHHLFMVIAPIGENGVDPDILFSVKRVESFDPPEPTAVSKIRWSLLIYAGIWLICVLLCSGINVLATKPVANGHLLGVGMVGGWLIVSVVLQLQDDVPRTILVRELAQGLLILGLASWRALIYYKDTDAALNPKKLWAGLTADDGDIGAPVGFVDRIKERFGPKLPLLERLQERIAKDPRNGRLLTAYWEEAAINGSDKDLLDAGRKRIPFEVDEGDVVTGFECREVLLREIPDISLPTSLLLKMTDKLYRAQENKKAREVLEAAFIDTSRMTNGQTFKGIALAIELNQELALRMAGIMNNRTDLTEGEVKRLQQLRKKLHQKQATGQHSASPERSDDETLAVVASLPQEPLFFESADSDNSFDTDRAVPLSTDAEPSDFPSFEEPEPASSAIDGTFVEESEPTPAGFYEAPQPAEQMGFPPDPRQSNRDEPEDFSGTFSMERPELTFGQGPDLTHDDTGSGYRPNLKLWPARLVGMEPEGLRLDMGRGHLKTLPYQRVEEMVAGVIQNNSRPQLVLDLVLDGIGVPKPEHRVIRLGSLDSNPLDLLPQATPKTAWQQFSALLLQATGARPLKGQDAVTGRKYQFYPSLQDYETDIYH
ncbi:MAG: hypothetical protein QNK37_38820 [Acidobacteriota bacterium]|nr:hypothetical protein [Acidobacteriota bacterium]